MLEQKYIERAKEQTEYYANGIPSPGLKPSNVTSRGISAITAWLLIDKEAQQVYENSSDFWYCEMSTALRTFGLIGQAESIASYTHPDNVAFLIRVREHIREVIGMKRILLAPVRINHNQDSMTIQQMLIQLDMEEIWLP